MEGRWTKGRRRRRCYPFDSPVEAKPTHRLRNGQRRAEGQTDGRRAHHGVQEATMPCAGWVEAAARRCCSALFYLRALMKFPPKESGHYRDTRVMSQREP